MRAIVGALAKASQILKSKTIAIIIAVTMVGVFALPAAAPAKQWKDNLVTITYEQYIHLRANAGLLAAQRDLLGRYIMDEFGDEYGYETYTLIVEAALKHAEDVLEHRIKNRDLDSNIMDDRELFLQLVEADNTKTEI